MRHLYKKTSFFIAFATLLTHTTVFGQLSATASTINEEITESATPAIAASTPAVIPDPFRGLEPLGTLYQSAIVDLQPLMFDDNSGPNFDRLAQFQFSAKTREQFGEVFGNENPIHVVVKTRADDGHQVDTTIDKLQYLSADKKARFDFDGAVCTTQFDKPATHADLSFNVPMLRLGIADNVTMEASDINGTSNRVRGAQGLWFGKTTAHIDQIVITLPQPGVEIALKGMTLDANLVQHGKLLDLDYAINIDTISWPNDQLKQTHFDIHLSHISIASLLGLKDQISKINAVTTPAQKTEVAKDVLRKWLYTLLLSSPKIELRDLSTRYHGQAMKVMGYLNVNHIQKHDLDDVARFSHKINVHFAAAFSKALVTEVVRTFANQQQKTEQGAELTDAQLDSLVEKISVPLIKTAIDKHWLRQQGQEFTSTFEIKNGRALLNGQDLDHLQSAKTH